MQPPVSPAPEVIEIGIVELGATTLTIAREASSLVRPRSVDTSIHRTRLTGITRADLVNAPCRAGKERQIEVELWIVSHLCTHSEPSSI